MNRKLAFNIFMNSRKEIVIFGINDENHIIHEM